MTAKTRPPTAATDRCTAESRRVVAVWVIEKQGGGGGGEENEMGPQSVMCISNCLAQNPQLSLSKFTDPLKSDIV